MAEQITQFSTADLDRIRRESFVEGIEYLDETTSTNDVAIQLAARSDIQTPLLVLTERQTAGRGRGDNRWWSAAGALTFSLLLETKAAGLTPQHWPQVSLTVGLAVCEVIEKLADRQAVWLKWPNDVLINERKLCGILSEVPPGQKGMLVLGIGLNVNNTLADAPTDLHSKATSLFDIAGRRFSMSDVLIDLLHRLHERVGSLGKHDDQLVASWRRRCLLTNRQVRLTVGERLFEGRCQGIGDDGALIVETANGVERCFAGVVTQF